MRADTCLASRLVSLLYELSLISSHRFGFLDAKTSFTEHLDDALNEKLIFFRVFNDLRKVFDTVNHSLLPQK